MFDTIAAPNEVFVSFDLAKEAINKREYEDIIFNPQTASITKSTFKIADKEYPMYDVFLDAVFSLTGLPRKNEKILPTENVVQDLCTLIELAYNTDEKLCLRLLDGNAYTLFKLTHKDTVRQPLDHKRFINALENNIDLSLIKRIVLTPKFMRVTTLEDDENNNLLADDGYFVGKDYVNGELFKGFTLTVGLTLRRKLTNGEASAPCGQKYSQLRMSDTPNKMAQKFAEMCTNIEPDLELAKFRLNRLTEIPMTIPLLKFISTSMNFATQDVKDKLFGGYYEVDDDGKLTKDIRASSLKDITLYEFYSEICRLAPEVDEVIRYRMEFFAGSLLNENNKKVLDALAMTA